MEWLQRLNAFYDTIRPVLDVAILAFLIYKAYEFLVKTQAMQMIKGAGFVVLVYVVAVLLKLATLKWLLNIVGPGLVVAVAIIFQPELRKIILRLGQNELFRPNAKPLGQLDAVITAAEILSQKRRGMLIVFPGRENLRHIVETGTKLNADISSYIIVAIFEFDGPLHDGAMVIHHGRIAAAGCYLPLSEQQDIKKSFGTRHRASLGMSEQSDAVILVVSEETGAISIAFNGKLYYDLSADRAAKKLQDLMKHGERGKDGEQADVSPEDAGKDVILEH
ncbi:MAG: diadenylate cyclase CdaA [Spirochaetaceae bacterium]|jgi:diadenylate cyclase|nr:diadenylate cyclase CdaA [Spirochaetaceae bacterium]